MVFSPQVGFNCHPPNTFVLDSFYGCYYIMSIESPKAKNL